MDEGADLVGRTIAGKYAVRSVIGHGAMGTVYRARQIALDKVIALKVLNDDLRGDPEFVARFHTEARAASRLDHPNSTRVIDFGEEPDGLLYIAMEMLEGMTLADLLLREFPLRPERVASILSQALSAIGAAHALGVLHRDLKPENIVVLERRDDEDRPIDVVKVCDFGIAKLEGMPEHSDGIARLDRASLAASELRSPTRAGVVVGTPQYMSPEQARGEALDVRSDVYALGVVLFELLTGHAPFNDGTPAEVLWMHATKEPPKPSALHPSVDPQLEAICLRAMRKNRDERFASAREMRHALRPLLEESPRPPSSHGFSEPRVQETSAPTISATSVGLNPPRRSRRRIVWALPLVAAAVAAAAFGVHRDHFRPARVRASAPTQTATFAVAATAPAPDAVSATAMVTATATATPTAHKRRRIVAKQTIETTADVIPTDIDPPPPPPAPTPTLALPPPPPVATAPPPPPRPAVVRADPARVHVDLGAIRADRVTVGSIESVLKHVDFTSCYRAEVARGAQADGAATLVLDTDEERITHAELVGGAFSPALRQCVAHVALGLRIRDADTGGASAKVQLRFSLR